MKHSSKAVWLASLVLVVCSLVPRLQLVGEIPAVQPQWALRADQFWDALSEGKLRKTYFATHPGLTVMWYAGAAQQLSDDESRWGLVIAASRASAVVGSMLILLAAWLIRKILLLDRVKGAGAIAMFCGLVLALDPFLIYMTGLIGLDGPVALAMLVAFLVLVLHLRQGSHITLLAAGLSTGLAVATKAPGLLLLPAPMILWFGNTPIRPVPWRKLVITLLALVAGAALVTWALLPAAWAHPLSVAKDLLVGQDLSDESLKQVLTQGHLQFFMGEHTRDPGAFFYPVQLLYRATPLVTLGLLLGLLTPAFRRSRLVREAALFAVIVLVGLTVTDKKIWRYVSVAVPILDLLGALGVWFFVRQFAGKWPRVVVKALPWVVVAAQGVWVLNAAPYYALRLNPLLGGPRAAIRVIEVAVGEGLEQVLAFLEGEAQRMDKVISWSGGSGSSPGRRKALEFQSEWLIWKGRGARRTPTDCYVYYLKEIQRGQKQETPAAEYWRENGVVVLSVVEHGVELATVKCREDLGIPSLSERREPMQVSSRSPERLPSTIVFVSLDTTRADHLSAYGYGRPTTPYLKKVAEEGIRFDTAISPMPTTDPSHLTMFTGLHPRTHGVLHNGVRLKDPSRPNLVTWLQGLGYRTGAFISRQHLVPSSLDLFGFDFESGPDDIERLGEETVDAALEWIDRLNGERIFVWLHLFDPHFPYEPPAEYRAQFQQSEKNWPTGRRKWARTGGLPAAREQFLIDLYDAEIAYADSQVERFLTALQDRFAPGESPLLVVTGDHGESLGEHWESLGYAFDHGELLSQGQLKVPLIWRWPGRLPEGAVVTSVTGLVDIVPTLFDLLDAEGFPTQGRSLLPSLAGLEKIGPEARSPRPGLAFSQRKGRAEWSRADPEEWDENFAVQDDRHKLILTVSGDEESTALYDLWQDPQEQNDLSASATDDHDRLLAEIRAWLVDAPLTGAEQEIPEEKLEALRALGYLD